MPVDFSPLTAPVPESPSSQGLKYFGDALDAVMQRRHQMELAKQQQEATLAHQTMMDDRERQRMKLVFDASMAGTKQRAASSAERQALMGRKFNNDQERDDAHMEVSIRSLLNSGDEEGAAGLSRMLEERRAGRAPAGTPPPAPSPGPAPTAAPPPAQAPTPSPTPAFRPDFMASLADVATKPSGELSPPPAGPGPYSNAELAAEAPPIPAADPAAAVAAPALSGNAALADQWRQSQLAIEGPPSLKPIVEQEAANIRLKGRSYIPEAAKMVNSERQRLQSGANALLTGQRRTVLSAGDEARLTETQVKGFGAEADRWEKQQNADKLTDAYEKFAEFSRAVEAYSATGDTVSARNSLYQIARYITGPGVLTKQEYSNTVANTAGWSADLASKIAKGVSGDVGAQEWAAIQLFVKNAQKAVRDRARKVVRNYDLRFGPKDHYAQEVPGQVSSYRDSLVARFGLTELETTPVAPRGGGVTTKKGAAPAAEKSPAERLYERLSGGGAAAVETK